MTQSIAQSSCSSHISCAESDGETKKFSVEVEPRFSRADDAAVRRVLVDFDALLRNRNFVCLLLAFGIGLGVFNAVLTLIAQLLAPCGYDADIAGFASGALLGAGLLGAAAAGVVLERTRAYVPVLKVAVVALGAATVLMLASLRPGAAAFPVAAFGAAGLLVLPVLPITLENAAECTWPVPEDNSAGLLMLAGQAFGVVFIFALPPLLAVPPSSDCSSVATPAAGLILASLLAAAVAVLFVRVDYRRQAAEAAGGPTAAEAGGGDGDEGK
jgi:FLVCR family MFS transporter 7